MLAAEDKQGHKSNVYDLNFKVKSLRYYVNNLLISLVLEMLELTTKIGSV